MVEPPNPRYVPPPRALPGFPGAVRIKPKTSFPGGLRPRWRNPAGDILEWDFRHGRVECYDARGRHFGEFDPGTGERLGEPNPMRRVEP